MKKILLQLDTDRCPSAFDSIAAYDAGVDIVQPYANVRPEDVRDIVYGAIFTRGRDDLKNTAIWIGGTNFPQAEEMLKVITGTFFGYFHVSVMLDAMGCTTTSAALVARIAQTIELRGCKAVIFGGGGRVGARAATLMASEGARVLLALRRSPTVERAEALCRDLRSRYGVEATCEVVETDSERQSALDGATILVNTGPPGLRTVPRAIWSAVPTLQAVADVNAVPPLGVEGVEMGDNGTVRDGKKSFGAIGLGIFKMKVHYACVAQLFERSDLVVDHVKGYEIAKEVAATTAGT